MRYDRSMDTRTFGYRIADCHCDTIYRLAAPGFNFSRSNSHGHLDLPRMRRGKVALQFFAVCTAPEKETAYLRRALHYLRLYHRCLEENRDSLRPVERRSCAALASAEGRIACLLALEGAEPLEGDPGLVEIFYRLGVRCLSLTWNRRNFAADGSGEEAEHGGLTKAGRRLVQKMGELGIILDLAHLAEHAFAVALDLAAKPPLVTHANARALCDHPRNLRDSQLKALAARGGVVGLSYYPVFVTGEKRATLDRLADHFVHVAGVVGPAHLAIGSDFDGITRTVIGLEDASCHGRLVEALSRRGFSSAELDQITWGNVVRVVESNLHE